MKIWAGAFISIGLAAAAIALSQPDEQSIPAQRNHIRTIMAKHGYASLPNADIGDAVTVMRFSSSACDNVRVLPVSVLSQESVILKGLKSSGDVDTFIYIDKRWDSFDAATDHVATLNLSQKFLQMFRVVPSTRPDAMLYVIAPKKCGAVASFDWSGFWTGRA
jgi:hypothetical protein